MSYYTNDEQLTLAEVQIRIKQTDLVPSRSSLMNGIEANFKVLSDKGITTLAHLRKELKTPRRQEALSELTGIQRDYLAILRREIEGYFPRPTALKSFDWLPGQEITRLEEMGLKHISSFFEAVGNRQNIKEFSQLSGVEPGMLEELFQLADLTRVQWVSPLTARMLMAAGYNSASSLASADADELCQELDRINAGGRYFKGKIGLRDIKRLVQAAAYVPK